MIIAPNGTGKSTFVCAVCLGLAGAPTLLGRQKTVAGFIKNGEESAVIQITLKDHGDEKDIVITREIYQNNKSDWQLNKRTTSEAKVKSVLKGLNVQLDNLCQFLPQEKVASFAALDQKELLFETQRAVDVNLMNQHNELIEFDNQKRDLTSRLAEAQKELAGLELDKERYEEEAKKYAAHKKKNAEIDDHEKLIPFARLEDLKKEQEALKKDRNDIKMRLDQYKVDMAPFEEAKEDIEKLVTDATNSVHDKAKMLTELKINLETKDTEIEKTEDRIGKLKDANDQLEARSNEKKIELENICNTLSEVKEALLLIDPIDEEAIAENGAKASRLYEEKQDLESQKGELEERKYQCERNIQRAQVDAERAKRDLTSDDKIRIFNEPFMRSSKPAQETKKAVGLLRSELRDIRNEFFEPPCLTVTATTPRYRDYLEALVPTQTTLSITAISKEAYDRHSRKFIEQRNVTPSFRYLSNATLREGFPRDKLKELGFDGYLKDFVQGPKPVVQMLCEVGFIHDVPVAMKPLSTEQLDFLRNPPNGRLIFKKFFSGDMMYTVSQSIYGSKQVLSRANRVSRAQYYSDGGVSEAMKAHIHQQIKTAEHVVKENEANIESLNDQILTVDKQLNEVKKEFSKYRHAESSLREKKKKKESAEARIKLFEEKKTNLENEAKRDYTPEIYKNHERIKKLSVSKMTSLCSVAKLQADINIVSRDVTLLEIERFEAENKKRSLNSLFKFIINEKDRLEKKLNEAKRKIQEFKNNPERVQLREQAAAYDEETKVRLTELINQYRAEDLFSESGILSILDGLRAELSLLGSSSKSSVNRLEDIMSRLATLNHSIPEFEGQIQMISKQMREIQSDWEPKLEAMVNKISTKFSLIFPTVGSAGEVRIAKSERFADWRMEIMVKFREEADLKALDPHTQSGGERAVSTVYYMISMQELTTSPFRVVDEINQGMDARNERIVHKHMVEVACQQNTSQYFLITPKLLTNLHYDPNMRVHCIMAGPWTPDPSKKPEFLGLGATALYD
jgi:chromosome segregation ATPase